MGRADVHGGVKIYRGIGGGRYRDDAGKEHSRRFDRKIDAQQWLDRVTAAVVAGTYADPHAGRITFAAFFSEGRLVRSGRPARCSQCRWRRDQCRSPVRR